MINILTIPLKNLTDIECSPDNRNTAEILTSESPTASSAPHKFRQRPQIPLAVSQAV
jgi:hypothetical protein